MIHIVGLGGVGFWVAAGLARSIPADQLACWDDDDLTGTGATRLPMADKPTKKVDLLQGFLAVVIGSPQLPVFYNRRFSGQLNITRGDLVVDCTDMDPIPRKRMWTMARNEGATMLRVSYDGASSTIVASTGLPLFGGERGGYAEMPTFGLSLAAGGIGAELVRRYLKDPVAHFELSLSIEKSLKGEKG